MIRSLDLTAYGRFARRHFDFGEVTLFLGPNESGKSTVFDALGEVLCNPPKTTTFGKRLEGRYGPERRVTVDPEEAAGTLSAETFLNLLAVDSAGISITVGDRSDWLDDVKSQLFSGGVDPKRVKRLLDDRADTRANRRHMKERAGKVEKLEAERRHRRELDQRREEVLRAQHRATSLDEELGQIETQLTEVSEHLSGVEAEIAHQERIDERERLQGIWQQVEKAKSLESSLEELAAVREDEGEELRRLTGAAENARAAAERAEVQAQHARDAVTTATERAHRAERAAEEEQPRSSVAGELRERVRTAEAERPTTRVVSWRPWALVAAAVALMGGVAALVLLPGAAAIGGAVGGIALSALFVVLARSVAHVPDESAVTAAVEEVRDRWRRRFEEDLSGRDAAALRDELYRKEQEAQRLHADAAARREELRAAEERRQRTQAAAEEARQEADRASRAVTEWLTRRGISRTEEYWKLRERAERFAAEREEARTRVERAMDDFNADTPEALQAEVSRRIKDLDASITAPPKSEAEVRALRSERARLIQEKERLAARRGEVNRRAGEATGSVQTAMGNLPEEIAQCDRRIALLEEEIAELDTTRRAAEWAAQMFAEVASDTTTMLADLAEDIAREYGSLVGDDRAATLSEIDPMKGRVQDRSGVLRAVGSLSQGTRDSFVLASRLVLAERALSSPGILLFDEAFAALDLERRSRALALLRRFREEHGWQLVIFTMDPGLAEEVQSSFPGAVVHELTPEGEGKGGQSGGDAGGAATPE